MPLESRRYDLQVRESREDTMQLVKAAESPRNERSGQVSYLLLAPGQFGSDRMAITMVHCEPGSEQPMHSHPDADQVYVIVAGRGLMRVDQDAEAVEPGTLVFIPRGSEHAIRNTGTERLVYVSATSPPFEIPASDSPFAYIVPRETAES